MAQESIEELNKHVMLTVHPIEAYERMRIQHLIEQATSDLLYSTHQFVINVFGKCDLQNAIDATRSILDDIEDSLNAI